MPTYTSVSPGSLSDLPLVLQDLGVGSALLVHGGGVAETPWPARVSKLLHSSGVGCEVFSEVESNPRHTTVDRIGQIARASKVSGIVGLGGGSTLDAAKAAAMLASNDGGCEDYEGRERYINGPLPFVAIPTTCGSGSEVTYVSVINHAPERRKMSVKGETMFASAAIVDADLLATLPSWLVASTGADALTHAIEAYVCRAANPISNALAESAVALVFDFLPGATADIESDATAREALMRASTLAGMAFGNSDVASVHCLSESLGGLDPDIPHGLANAMLLPVVLRYQLSHIRRRLGSLWEVIGHSHSLKSSTGEDSAELFLSALDELLSTVNIPVFASLAVDPDTFPQVAKMAEANGSNASSPRPMQAVDYVLILEEAMRHPA